MIYETVEDDVTDDIVGEPIRDVVAFLELLIARYGSNVTIERGKEWFNEDAGWLTVVLCRHETKSEATSRKKRERAQAIKAEQASNAFDEAERMMYRNLHRKYGGIVDGEEIADTTKPDQERTQRDDLVEIEGASICVEAGEILLREVRSEAVEGEGEGG